MPSNPLLDLEGPLKVSHAPFGADIRAMVEAVEHRVRPSVYVARDERQAQAALRLAQFFSPRIETVLIPGWDSLPYDRTSPSPEAAATRCAGLARLAGLANAPSRPVLFATTGSALVQRLPGREVWNNTSLALSKGSRLPSDRLRTFLSLNGFSRVSTVRDKGDFALRGGIVDIFPPDADEPVRLDFFGDELDTIRGFDPETQRSTRELKEIVLSPASEVFLDEESLARFRRNYLDAFGSPDGDGMYEAARAGIRRQGIEHWLPLFHDTLITLADLAPPETLWGFGHLAREAAQERAEQARDYFRARREAVGDGTLRAVGPDRLYLSGDEIDALTQSRPAAIFHALDADTVASLDARPGRDFAPERAAGQDNIFEAVIDHAKAERASGRTVLIAGWTAGSTSRLVNVLNDHGGEDIAQVFSLDAAIKSGQSVAELPIEAGFRSPDLSVLSEQDILGDRLAAPRKKRKAANYIAEVSALNTGDLVVHVDHGIARYDGLQTLDVGGAAHDCLQLVYAGGDKLFLPVENIELISRYGAEGAESAIDRLGGAGWQARKAKAKKRIFEMAEDLIRTAAARALKTVESVDGIDGVYQEFAARFPYEETDDQLNAIEDVISDLTSNKAMDRLVCGDVGFGKTEVALRGAFVAAMSGMQVAVIAPTTLLARQHYNTFAERFRGWPLNVRHLSRLVNAKDAAAARQGLKTGDVDVVIGTHALLAKGIEFRNLGLLIVDEEQRFGVKHKERLKELKADVHVLTLSATPIPRTLQLALTGIRDLSIIATPPVDRLSVRTYVTEFDTVTLREALLREKYRGGQAFFVAPRIADLDRLERFLGEKVPEVKFITAHGQMTPTELEDIMNAFYEGEYDVLLSTTIVESGLDIPSANTIIIHRADMFGLAQLYQLRGRVGRSKLRAYAYLTTPQDMVLTESAEKRLRIMHSLDSLGAGFQLASHDLDMRGGGNLLGDQQSGHIREVGAELYQQMLEDAVKALQAGEAEVVDEEWSPSINLGAAVLIPETYVEDLSLRLSLYRRLADLKNEEEREGFAAELIDRFGSLPEETRQLLAVTAIKSRCKALGISKLDAGPKGAVLSFRDDTPIDPAGLMRFVLEHASRLKLRPNGKLAMSGNWTSGSQRLAATRALLGQLERLVPEVEAEAA